MSTVLRSQVFKNIRSFTAKRPFSSKIADDDVVLRLPYSDYSIVRMKPDHIPLVYPTLEQFFYEETISKALKIQPKKEWMHPFIENLSRYPISYFLISEESHQADAIFLQEIVYRDPSTEEKTRQKVKAADGDSFNILGNMIDYLENRIFEMKPEVNKLIHSEIAVTRPNIRGKGFMGLLTKVVLDQNLNEHAALFDVNSCMGLITSVENTDNLMKNGFEILEILPDRFYVDEEGKPFRPAHGDPNACLSYFDFDKARAAVEEKKLRRAHV